jgi:patatin-like phospholipase/acyl hydrolase
MTLKERILAPGAKKILALDGGGIRGMMTVEILAAIEEMLRRELGETTNFVLADFFDFVAGTSTGAIIAACIALGKPMKDIRRFYLESGKDMFDKANVFRRYTYNKYDDERLAEKLRKEIGPNQTLGSPELKTLLMLVMRNATTDSPWPIANNPYAKYNLENRRQTPGDCNLDLPLWQLVRASTAAPVYFPPEVVCLGPRKFVFVDGGITTYNNPAFRAFLMATVEPYNLNWPTGENQMLVVSIGTGTSPGIKGTLKPSDMHLLYNAESLPSALMSAALTEQDFLCRVFGKCLCGDPLDREIEDMIDKRGPVHPKLFTYVRYNAELSREGLESLGLHDIVPENVQKLDSVEHIEELRRIGTAIANKALNTEDFKPFL